jgi:hypothetical protein
MILLDKNVLEVGYTWGVKKLGNGHWRPAWKIDLTAEGEWETQELAKLECDRRNKRWWK